MFCRKYLEKVTGKLKFKKELPILLTSWKMRDNSSEAGIFSRYCNLRKVIVKTLCQNCKLGNIELFRILIYYVEHSHWYCDGVPFCHSLQVAMIYPRIVIFSTNQFWPYFVLHEEGPYHTETSPLFCSANQWTGFYLIGTFVMKELKAAAPAPLKLPETEWESFL